MQRLLNQHVVVVGLGKSGIGAAKLALSEGAKLTVTDAAERSALSAEALSLDAEFYTNGHHGVPFGRADLIVVSPGVPAFAELSKAEASGVDVISELEFASRFLGAPIVCVGGTNGKSTVTTLLGGLMAESGYKAFVGGNLGTPLSSAVGVDFDVLVVEVSSFQLERIKRFRPKVSVLLNIAEDHLDRYTSFSDYACAKGNAFVNQTTDDVAVIPSGDSECARQAGRGRGQSVRFGPAGDYFLEGTDIVEKSTDVRFDLTDCDLFGLHNLSNACAAVAAARALGADEAGIRRGLVEFKALSHRMQLVRERHGVRYYDDSKATNVSAAVTALSGLTEPRVVLIAGGRDKGGAYAPLADALGKKGRAVVLLGEAAERIAREVAGVCRMARAASMEEAVQLAAGLAEPGDAVLLSPACSSFDQFSGYAERGKRFQTCVRLLPGAGQREVAS